eukprot:3248669-Amphidinium_carterae.1
MTDPPEGGAQNQQQQLPDVTLPKGADPAPQTAPKLAGSSAPRRIQPRVPGECKYNAKTQAHGWSVDEEPLRDAYINLEQLVASIPVGCFCSARSINMGAGPHYNTGYVYKTPLSVRRANTDATTPVM